MVSAFLGALIPLERAVAMKQPWMYAAPLFAGLGGVGILILPGSPIGPLLLTIASLGGVAILIEMTRREPALHTAIMLLGMVAWFVGNILWLFGWPIFQVVYLWQAFLVLTIAGERLELSRVLRPAQSQRILFSFILLLYLAGTLLAVTMARAGTRISGIALLLLCLWSIRNDLAWRNIRHKVPLTRYIAWCLVLGFIWLGIGGFLQVLLRTRPAGPIYDATLHMVFVGFTISMIFGHAPIIFPAILGLPISFHCAFYLQLVLLHASLALRVFADYAGWHTGRMWGGLLNEVAILMFLGMTIWTIRKSLVQQ